MTSENLLPAAYVVLGSMLTLVSTLGVELFRDRLQTRRKEAEVLQRGIRGLQDALEALAVAAHEIFVARRVGDSIPPLEDTQQHIQAILQAEKMMAHVNDETLWAHAKAMVNCAKALPGIGQGDVVSTYGEMRGTHSAFSARVRTLLVQQEREGPNRQRLIPDRLKNRSRARS